MVACASPKPMSLECLMTRGRQLPDSVSLPEASVRMPVSTATSPQLHVGEVHGPIHGRTLARTDPGLAFSLLSTGDAIPTMKPSPSPSSSGHQYKKFSFEGTMGLSHASGTLQSGGGVAMATLTCLTSAELLCISDKEPTPVPLIYCLMIPGRD